MRLVTLILALFLIGCSTEDDNIAKPTPDPPDDPVVTRVRVANSTPADYSSIELSFPNDPFVPVDFGSVQPHQTTEYQEVPAAYTFVHAEIQYSSGETFDYKPELAASQELPPGDYTYRVVWSCNGMIIEAKADESGEEKAAVVATRITLSPAVVGSGDDVRVTIGIKNQSSNYVLLDSQGGARGPVGLSVATSDDTYLFAYPGCSGPGELVLRAGEERLFELGLSTEFWEMEPGQYLVRGGVDSRGDEFPWAGPVVLTVE